MRIGLLIINKHSERVQIMRKSIYSVIVFTILIAANLIGCTREITELMPIKDVEIYTAAIDLPDAPDVFAISVLVTGTLSDKCIENYEIDHDMMPHVFDRYPIYSDGDTISIEIKQTITEGWVSCDIASPYYIDMIFLGFCEPGEYTIDVNGYTETFSVV